MTHYVHMDCNPDYGYKIQYTCCVRIMVIPMLKLVKGKAEYEAATTENGNASSEYDKYVKAVLK